MPLIEVDGDERSGLDQFLKESVLQRQLFLFDRRLDHSVHDDFLLQEAKSNGHFPKSLCQSRASLAAAAKEAILECGVGGNKHATGFRRCALNGA